MSKSPGNPLFDFWFPKNTSDVIVVTSEENAEKKSIDALTTSENYSFLDNVGDRDTLIDTGMFLSRHYPKARIKQLFPRNFNDKDDSSSNIVVIGGPANNSLCKRFMTSIESQVSYSFTDWTMRVLGNKYEDIHDKINGMKKDYGYFSSFSNPLNKRNRIILINGINTFGVVGAFKAFSDLNLSKANFDTVRSVTNDAECGVEFECFFEVTVHNCELLDCTKVVIDYPTVDRDNVFPIGAEDTKSQLAATTKIIVPALTTKRKPKIKARDLLNR